MGVLFVGENVMGKRPIPRFLKQEAFFSEVAHAVYAHSLLSFLCDVEYSSIDHDFILASRETIGEEFDSIREILLNNFPKDDESTLECQDYVREHFNVGLEILHLIPPDPVQLHIVNNAVPMIEPSFLRKEDMMIIVGQASVAHGLFMEGDSFEVPDSKEVEERSLVVISAILVILLRELTLHAPLVPLCEKYVMKEYELII